MINKTIIFCFTGLCLQATFPQNVQPVFTHLTIKDGLSQSTVEEILQDKKGFMWFGTNDGLNRYDGYNFTTYRYDPTDSNSISDNYIYKICEDDSGFLWIATNNGLNKYDPVTNKFTRFLNNPDDSASLSFNLVHTVIKDKNNNIWAGTLGGGLNLFERSTQKFHRIIQTDKEKNIPGLTMITSLCEDKNGNIRIGTYTGSIVKMRISDINSDTEVTPYNFFLTTLEKSAENIIWDIKEDKKGFLWIATNRTGAVKFDPESETATYFRPEMNKNSLNDFSVRKIFIDNDGVAYFGTKTGGINILDTDRNFSFILSDENPGSLNDNSIWSVYKDRKGSLWVGTEFGGINKYDPYRSKFEHFHSYSNNLRKERVLFFYEEDNDKVIIGTDGGLISFDYKKKTFKNIPGTNDLENEIITSILEDGKNIWVGTNSRGLFKIYPDRRIKKFQAGRDKNAISNNNIKVMIKSSSRFFWLGTYGGGVDLFDPLNEKVVYHLSSKGIKENFIYSLLEEDEILWIGTYGDGLVRFNTLTGEIKRFTHNPDNPHSIINNRIYSLNKDSKGRLWVGTTGGLSLFNLNDETFTAFTIKDGLANDVIYSIIEDDGGFLWLSTNRGLTRFDYETKSFKNFTPKDGLQDYEFNRGAALKTKDGKLFFGGINGFNVIKPGDIQINKSVPPVVITSFKKMNKEVSFPRSISEVDTIILSYDENFFSFAFAALDFTDPENNNYAYMMDGFNEDWIYSGNDRTATYTNLNAGTYTFRVKGSNNDGVWNEEGASVMVIVLPPFWETWWFRSLAVIILIGILYSFYRIRLQRAIEIERLRTRIASDLHDDIGSNLTRIAMQSELILEDVNKGDYKKPLKEIGEKSRELVTTMSDVVWSIDARNDSVANLLDRMKEFSHSLLTRKNIFVSFNQEGLEEDKELPVDVRQNIYLIFKEAVNNIAKHSNASEVKVVLKNSEDKFELRISDNGSNKSFTERKTGHGLKNMRMRAERIGGSIEIKSENGFEILLNCKKI